MRIFNRAGFAATALFVVRSGQSGWSGNLLNRGQLAPGEFLAVRLGEGGGCSFDLRMVLINGTEILRNDADVCATRSVDLAPPTPPPPPAAVPPTPQVGGADRFLPTIEPAPRP